MRLPVLASAMLVAACAAVPPANTDRAELADVLNGRVAAGTQSCVPITPGVNLTVLNSDTLLYDRGGTVWVNELRGSCPGLGTTSTLIVEPSSGQYCRGDQFREIEWGATIPGPTCVLGDFTAYRRPG